MALPNNGTHPTPHPEVCHDSCAGARVIPGVSLLREDKIARSIVFLCSDEASYITGTTLTPDGGFTLTR
jgi:NAD(P)-dependent dehydrogenase (short-subunit alcohol dehydrogenase family)